VSRRLNTRDMAAEDGDDSPRSLAIRAGVGVAGAAAGSVVPGGAFVAAALTPFGERALSFLVDRFQQHRSTYAAETLADAASVAGATSEDEVDEFILKLVADEEHQELLARVLTVAQDIAMRDKRRALGRILANAADETGTMVDMQFLHARVIADLDPVHVRLLRLMSSTPEHLRHHATERGLDPEAAARRWYQWSVAAADPGLSDAFWAAVQVLEHHGLVGNLGESWTHGGTMEPEYEITEYGDFLLNLLHDPDVTGAEDPAAAAGGMSHWPAGEVPASGYEVSAGRRRSEGDDPCRGCGAG
jgi:hypothetical protein